MIRSSPGRPSAVALRPVEGVVGDTQPTAADLAVEGVDLPQAVAVQVDASAWPYTQEGQPPVWSLDEVAP
jgi:hypothetical protein